MSSPCPWNEALHAAHRRLSGFSNVPAPVREEIAQEAVLRALTTDTVDCASALVARIARNLAVDWLRRRREVAWTGWEPASRAWQERTEARIDVGRALAILEEAPHSYRDTVLRLYLDEEDVSDLIAEAAPTDEAEWKRARDCVYKRRARGLRWVRDRLNPPPPPKPIPPSGGPAGVPRPRPRPWAALGRWLRMALRPQPQQPTRWQPSKPQASSRPSPPRRLRRRAERRTARGPPEISTGTRPKIVARPPAG